MLKLPRKENYKYFYLLKELSITGFKLKYSDSVLGYLWSLCRPLLLFIIYYLVFTYIFKIGGGVDNYPVYLLIGIVLWQFFTETTSLCMASIQSSGSLIRKVYFPRIILPLAASLTSVLTLLLNFIVIIGFVLFAGIIPKISWLFVAPLLLEFFLFTLGVSLILATFFVKYRDVGVIWSVFITGAFYGTPILYPIAMVPENLQKLMMLNPAAQIIQDIRYVTMQGTVVNTKEVLGMLTFIPYAVIIILLAVGYISFQKRAAKFAEEV